MQHHLPLVPADAKLPDHRLRLLKAQPFDDAFDGGRHKLAQRHFQPGDRHAGFRRHEAA